MKKAVMIVAVMLSCLLCGGIGWIIGFRTAPPPAETQMPWSETFYATVTACSDTQITAEGLDVNDVNHRGPMVIAADENTVYEWRHTPMERHELQAGDRIAVTYSGDVAEIYPPVYHGILRIQLLDDEK
ncbi:MAG: hypothetical protein IJN57_07380 [Oscillospiraceae bacterium]|nr:hypothetical protein [Oscillospiraceae bacterium]